MGSELQALDGIKWMIRVQVAPTIAIAEASSVPIHPKTDKQLIIAAGREHRELGPPIVNSLGLLTAAI